MLLDPTNKMELFFPQIRPEWRLPQLGAMMVVAAGETVPNDVFRKMAKKSTAFFVDGVRMKTKEGSEPSIITAVGIVKIGDHYDELTRIYRELKTNYFALGENQSETFTKKNGNEYEIEFKSVPDDTWHDEESSDDGDDESEYGQFELSDSEDESDIENGDVAMDE